MPIERKYERDIDLLLAEEFQVSPIFANWFLERTRFSTIEAKVIDVWVSTADFVGESDLVVLFARINDGQRFALLIEDKIDAPFQHEQEARYRLRAQREVAKGTYSEFEVIVCAPLAYQAYHAQAIAKFDRFISYEALAEFFRSHAADSARARYRADLLETAASRRANSWTRRIDEVTNEFWRTAYHIATTEFHDLEMKELEPTKGQTWVTFRPHDMPTRPRHIYVALKGEWGFVDLTFTPSREAGDLRERGPGYGLPARRGTSRACIYATSGMKLKSNLNGVWTMPWIPFFVFKIWLKGSWD